MVVGFECKLVSPALELESNVNIMVIYPRFALKHIYVL